MTFDPVQIMSGLMGLVFLSAVAEMGAAFIFRTSDEGTGPER